jgi:hypothetical protein
LQAISGSSGHPFCMPFILLGSRDLEEHDQISLVANWHCCDVFFELLTEIKKPPPQRQRPRDVGNVVPNFVINSLVMVCCLLLHFRSAYMYMDVIIPLFPYSFIKLLKWIINTCNLKTQPQSLKDLYRSISQEINIYNHSKYF